VTSLALQELILGTSEVSALRANGPRSRPQSIAARRNLQAARIAHRRACTVLLCSHFERYLYALNEETTEHLNSLSLLSEKLPEYLKLLQTRPVVDSLALQAWDKRSPKLEEFAREFSAMWTPGSPIGNLDHAPFLAWMKSPKVSNLIRYFRQFGLVDIFSQICRSPASEREMKRELQSLVDLRNGIAHGDQSAQPEATEVTEFRRAVDRFASRTDRVFSGHLARTFGGAKPW
jgi:hypothetical protein